MGQTTNQTNTSLVDSLNLTSFKGKARRFANHEGGLQYNPFRRIKYSAPARSNTANDAELGRAGGADGAAVEALAPVSLAATAPAQIQSPGDGQDRGSAEEANTTGDDVVTPAPSEKGCNRPPSRGTSVNGLLRNRNAPSLYKTNAQDHAADSEPEAEKLKKKKTNRWFKEVHPKSPFTLKNQLQRTFLNSWINILILAAPVGIALNFVNVGGQIVFAVNFVAIIPLAAMLGFATEEIALRTGETLGGLINATFGNAVELIVAVIALTHGEVEIVQTSLIGSILSNLLLVLGMCFFCGGLNRPKQNFNTVVAQTAASLLALAVASVIVPTVFSLNAASNTTDDEAVDNQKVAALSRGVSIILLVVYVAYLLFQLKTHSKLFNETSEKIEARPLFKKSSPVEGVMAIAKAGGNLGVYSDVPHVDGDMALGGMHRRPVSKEGMEDDDEEEPHLHIYVAIATLVVSTIVIGICAEFMVDGIQVVTAGGVISEEFIGLILLPIVGNAAEHATAVTVAIKDKMDLSIGVAVGSSMQVSLFLIPLLVVIGWIMGNEEMTLAFDIFQVAVLFVAVLLVNYLIADGESHWLEGFLLMMLYFIVAVCAWFYPAADPAAAAAAAA